MDFEAQKVYEAIKFINRKGYRVFPEPISDFATIEPSCYIRILRPNENEFKERRYLTTTSQSGKQSRVICSQKTPRDRELMHQKIKKTVIDLQELLSKKLNQHSNNYV